MLLLRGAGASALGKSCLQLLGPAGPLSAAMRGRRERSVGQKQWSVWPCHSTDGARVQEVEMFVKEGDLGPKLLPAAAKKLAGMSLDDQ